MRAEGGPDVIDSVPEPVEFFLADGDFLNNCVLEVVVLVGDEIVQSVDFGFGVFEEGHQEGFQLELLEEKCVVLLYKFEAESDNGGHVDQLELLAFVGFLGVAFEEGAGEVVQELFCGDKDVGGAVHPDGENVEFEVGWVFVVVDPHS